MEHRIYLSGPISNLTFDEVTIWRDEVTDGLLEYAEIIDPMRDVDRPESPDTLVTEALESVDSVMMTDRGIMVRDFTDTTNSTLLIVNLLNARQVSIGTVAELAWAYQLRIPTIVIIEDRAGIENNIHEHLFVREMSSFRVTDIKRAITVAKSIMGVPATRWAW